MAKKNPAVHCSYNKLIKIGDLKPNPRNPNTHPEEQIRLLAKNIKEEGWRHPITVSNQSGMIVTGHARKEAAQLLELKKVPVDFQDYESPKAEQRHMIFDNRIQELAEIDLPILKDNLEELNTGDFDMELTGFTDESLERLMTQFYPIDVAFQAQLGGKKKTVCPECGFEFTPLK